MRIAIFLIATLALFPGCGGPTPPQMAKTAISGTVTFKGEPLSGASLTFTPTGDTMGFVGTGRTDKNGVYVITDIRGAKGLAVGEFKVTISRRLLNGKELDPNDNTPEMDSPATESLPPRYSNPQSTELRATVTKDANPIDFHLK